MKNQTTLFIFYALGDVQNASWNYDQLPSKWWWVGKGTTIPCFCGPNKEMDKEKFIQKNPTTLDFPREEQFSGPVDTQDLMIKYLDQYFEELEIKGFIKKYKISNVYDP